MEYICSDFYQFNSAGYLATFSAWPEVFYNAIQNNDWTLEGVRFIHDSLAYGNYPTWLSFPVIFHHLDGYRMRDFLDTRTVNCFLISQHVKDVLEREGLTGWKTYPIKLLDKTRRVIDGYYGFSIIGKSRGIIKQSNFTKQKTSELFWEDENAWDGSDFFRLNNTRYQVVTERVMSIFKKEKIDAVRFVPLYSKLDNEEQLNVQIIH